LVIQIENKIPLAMIMIIVRLFVPRPKLKLMHQPEFLGLNASKEGPDEVLRIFVV